jgi:uncharacterized damage-inducible protein DinB
MNKTYRQGAIGALLDIYEKSILDLKQIIEVIPDDSLTIVLDAQTTDENCRSIQTILSHVVNSGYGYAISIHNIKGHDEKRPAKVFHTGIKDYLNDLDNVFRYTESIFKEFEDYELEPNDNFSKINTSWGQQYDVEQLFEHAIVHILRHKRQIEKFESKI